MWKDDLYSNSGRTGYIGAIYGWTFCPGFRVLTRYRVYSRFWAGGLLKKTIAKILWHRNVSDGVYISPRTRIGRGFRLPHPVGVVIGDGVIIGNNVTIYQGVTLGLLEKSERTGYPKLENDVTVFANATVVGNVVISRGAIVGANAFVNREIPEGARAVGAKCRIIGDQ